MTVDPQIQPILDLLSGPDMPSIDQMAVEDLRAGMVATAPKCRADGLTEVVDRTVPGPVGDIPIRIYRPEVAGIPPVVVFFHGGGFTIGSLDTHDWLAAELAVRANALVVAVDYRLAPEHKAPAAAEDAYAATAWVAAHGDALGADASRLAVAGDSAGANLSAVVALLARDRGGPAIAHQVLVYPVVDHHVEYPSHRENAEGYLLRLTDVHWFARQYLTDETAAADPRMSPIRAESHAGLPPALILTAEYDPIRDEGEAYGRRLADAGVPVDVHRYDGMIHGFVTFPGIDQAEAAIDEIAEVLRKALGS